MAKFSMSRLRSSMNRAKSDARRAQNELNRMSRQLKRDAQKQQQAARKLDRDLRSLQSKQRQALRRLRTVLNKPLTYTYSTSVRYQIDSYEQPAIQYDLEDLNVSNSADNQIQFAAEIADSLEREDLSKYSDPMEGDPLYSKLAAIDPSFSDEWRSACHALDAEKSENPSFARHFGVSVRELLTMLLKKYAPDHEIVSWDQAEFDQHGRPTRRTRFRYIFASHPSAADHFEITVNAGIQLYGEDLNKLTHTRSVSTASQICNMVKSNATKTIMMILEAIENR